VYINSQIPFDSLNGKFPILFALIYQPLNFFRKKAAPQVTASGDTSANDATLMETQQSLSNARVAPSQNLGLQVLHEPEQPNHAINIIFVHGLGGSAKETWTHPETKEFWPTWLQSEEGLENTRIMTFGYDSYYKNIFAPSNVLGIADFAEQLLDALDLHFAKYGNVLRHY